MKRWYAITAILALAFIISMLTCANRVTDLDRYKDELADVKLDLAASKIELSVAEKDASDAKKDASDANAELESVQAELSQLTATKEISFGNGLRLFEIEQTEYNVKGKVQNIGNTPMDRVYILIAFYGEGDKLDEVGNTAVIDLFPQEAAEWQVHSGYWSGQDVRPFDVYAIGDKTT